MCSISFLPRNDGLLLAMNRDEQLTRAAALPPETKMCGLLRAVYPSEPGGGTWIGANQSGLVAALVNWYERGHSEGRKSRGEIVPLALSAPDLAGADRLIGAMPVPVFNPFRLLLFDVRKKHAALWSCSDTGMERIGVSWTPGHWFSSGHDESTAHRIRSATCHEAAAEPDAGSIDWVRRLHRSHTPESGPFSLCMHRQDAQTVSYTEILVNPSSAECRYFAGSPCRHSAAKTAVLDIR